MHKECFFNLILRKAHFSQSKKTADQQFNINYRNIWLVQQIKFHQQSDKCNMGKHCSPYKQHDKSKNDIKLLPKDETCQSTKAHHLFRLHVKFSNAHPRAIIELLYCNNSDYSPWVHATFLWKGLEMATCLPNINQGVKHLRTGSSIVFIQHQDVSPGEHQPIANSLIWTSHDGLYDPKTLNQQVYTNSDQGNVYHLRKHAIQIYQEKWQKRELGCMPKFNSEWKMEKKHNNFGSVKCDPARKGSNFCCFTHHQQPRINKVKGHSSIEMDVSLP